MEEKIRELAEKHKIPEKLFQKAIQMEKERIIYQNRRLVPELKKLIERYASSGK